MLDRFLGRLDSFSNILKNLGIFALICLAVTLVGLNVAGNIILNKHVNPESGWPSKSSAPYQFKVTTTGQMLFAKTYSVSGAGDEETYTLPTFYTQQGVNYHLVKHPLVLVEHIWGQIEVKKR